MPWSYAIPAALRRRLEAVLAQRSFDPAEVWGEVVDWLNANGVAKPDPVEIEGSREGSALKDQ